VTAVSIASFLQPLDKPVPMVATSDIGRVAAQLIQEDRLGSYVVELEAAQRITPNEAAAAFARLSAAPSAPRPCRARRGKAYSSRRE
jgi:hypothetical protein